MTTSGHSPLDLDHDTMRRLAGQVADMVAEHLATLRAQPVIAALPRRDAEALVAGEPPAHGTGFDKVLDQLRRDVLAWHAREPHPGFMAYVPSCPTLPAVLGDWVATGFNVFAGVWPIASGPNAVELVVLDWFRRWLNLPAGAGGLLTSGGSAATFTAIVAARHHAIGDRAHDLPRLTLYTSDQAHSSVARAAWMAGVPRAHVRVLPTDGEFRLRPDALAAQVGADRAAGLLPFLVAATAGTTNTGAVDPLADIADLCAAERLWLHVDAAYAGCGAVSPVVRGALAGIERADSVTLDAHKWLFVPFECGGLLVRDPAVLRAAFHVSPEYLHDVSGPDVDVNFAEYGGQLTRAARALKVWCAVQHFGTRALAAEVEAGLARARHAEQVVRGTPELELLAPTTLGICCFRVRPRENLDDAALDALNERVLQRLTAEARWLISSTRLRGRLALRVCPIGFRTTPDDVAGALRRCVELAGEAEG